MKKLLLVLFTLTLGTAHAQETLSLYFENDVDTPNEASQQKLNEWIEENKNAEVFKIYGYADAKATNSYNMELSQRRADTIKAILQANKITLVDSVEVKAFGEDFDLAVDEAKNRKVTIFYENKVSEFVQAVKDAKKGETLRIPNLNFHNNSDLLLQSSIPVLKQLLKLLQETPILKIDIQGHICCQKKEKNEISLKRAVAIYQFLVSSGIDKERLTYQSFGSSRPIYPLPEKNEEERVANRRVEIQITDK